MEAANRFAPGATGCDDDGDVAAGVAAAADRALSLEHTHHHCRRHHDLGDASAAVARSVDDLLPAPGACAAEFADDGDDGPLPFCEPFKVKLVEAIRLPPRAERAALLAASHYNVFGLRSDEVFLDLLTDSGTSALSDAQFAASVAAPQAYAGSSAFFTLEEVSRRLFGFKHVLPVHQGRAAENVLFSTVVSPGQIVPNNAHFDTTEANTLRVGGVPLNLPVPNALDTALSVPFKGDMDVGALEALIAEKGAGSIPVVMLTVTNNSAGGQPVSMANIRAVSRVARRHGIPLFLDAARCFENAFFIRRDEPGYADTPLRDIVTEMFGYADGMTMSAKKEGLSSIGGLLCCNSDALYERLRTLVVVVEGFTSYGGLACRDLVAVARGLLEACDLAYQQYRHAQIDALASALRNAGVPIVEPPGGHAVYVDAGRMLPHIPQREFPAQALCAALYLTSGVRAVEIGSSCFGHTDARTGEFVHPKLELLRLAVPRRVYTDRHIAYVAEALARLYRRRDRLRGLRSCYRAPLLAHFTARFEPADASGLLLLPPASAAKTAAGAAPAAAKAAAAAAAAGDLHHQPQQHPLKKKQGAAAAAAAAVVPPASSSSDSDDDVAAGAAPDKGDGGAAAGGATVAAA